MWRFIEFRQLRAETGKPGASVRVTLPPELREIGAEAGKFVAVYVDEEEGAICLKLMEIEPPEIKLEVPE